MPRPTSTIIVAAAICAVADAGCGAVEWGSCVSRNGLITAAEPRTSPLPACTRHGKEDQNAQIHAEMPLHDRGIEGFARGWRHRTPRGYHRQPGFVGRQARRALFRFGEDDAFVVVDLPDNVAAATAAVAASGALRLQTIPLLTPEEVDKAVKQKVTYRPSGR